MKTKTIIRLLSSKSILAIIFLIAFEGRSQTLNRVFESHSVETSPIGCDTTNCFPFNRFAGPDSKSEMDDLVSRARNHQSIQEVRPAEEDLDGNWGKLESGLQLSLRFHKRNFSPNAPVMAFIILRNLNNTNTPLSWRNAPPDHGYKFILTDGTNVVRWARPQNPIPKIRMHDIVANTDPYESWVSAHCQELTIVNISQFLKLDHPGKYSLQVSLDIPPAGSKSTKSEIVSGKAEFDIQNN